MSLGTVRGQDRALGVLRRALARGALHHAYLFVGVDGVGKELTALGLAQALLCTEQRGEGCGECRACLRVAHRSHPDLTWVLAEEQQVARGWAGRADFARVPSREIRVEQVRALQERLSLKAFEGGAKLAIIVDAHLLTQQAQNALLKTLEEPAEGSVLVLVTPAAGELLPTLRSRMSTVTFAPLEAPLLEQLLQEKRKVDQATARRLAELAEGSVARALALDLEALSLDERVVARFDALEPADARPWLSLAADLGASRDEAIHGLQVLARVLRERALGGAVDAGAGAESRVVRLHRWLTFVDQASNAVASRNGSPRLALERMFIQMMTAGVTP